MYISKNLSVLAFLSAFLGATAAAPTPNDGIASVVAENLVARDNAITFSAFKDNHCGNGQTLATINFPEAPQRSCVAFLEKFDSFIFEERGP